MGVLKLIYKILKKFGDEIAQFWDLIIHFLKINWEVTLLVIVALFVIYILYQKYMGNIKRKKSG